MIICHLTYIAIVNKKINISFLSYDAIAEPCSLSSC